MVHIHVGFYFIGAWQFRAKQFRLSDPKWYYKINVNLLLLLGPGAGPEVGEDLRELVDDDIVGGEGRLLVSQRHVLLADIRIDTDQIFFPKLLQ
jgi:hypothetical protein